MSNVLLQQTNVKTMYLDCGEMFITHNLPLLSVQFTDINYIKNHKHVNVTN